MPPYNWMPDMFGYPLYFKMQPYVWTHPLYIWMCLYVWTPPYILGCTPVCLDTLMFALPPYVWMPPMFGHPSVWLDALHMFVCPIVCLDAAKCMMVSKGMRDIQTYGGCPNIQGHTNIWEHPNVWGHMDTLSV